ncbi:MAG: peptidylprolyl isomerase [Pseudomonadota bacterium]
MTLIATLLRAGSAALLLTTAAYAQDEVTADTVVATVNGTDITLGHMIVARSQLPEQYQQLAPDVLFEGLLEQLIQQEALESTMEELPKRIELALENDRRALLAGEALARGIAEADTEEALQAAYDARFANVEPQKEYNASHILVDTEEEAQAVLETLRGGADFAETAREKSTGPSGPNGGELGWFGTGRMVPEFETAVVALEVGALSEPVQTQFGWHVIILNDAREMEPPALEQVRGELEQQVQRDAADAYITELVDAATVTRAETGSIDPSVLGDLSLVDQ